MTLELPLAEVCGAPVSALRAAPDGPRSFEWVVASGFATVIECGGLPFLPPADLVAAVHAGGVCFDHVACTPTGSAVVFVDRTPATPTVWTVAVRSVRALAFAG